MTEAFLLAVLLALLQGQTDTGLIDAPGRTEVKRHCLACHSAKLITQNRASSEGWTQMIRWMQRTQGLWELGTDERTIVAYLAEHYGAQPSGRRMPLPPELLPPDEKR